jgi:hypothetical protein
MATHHELSNFIWQIADLLRGPYRPPQYERVMLPMTDPDSKPVIAKSEPLKKGEKIPEADRFAGWFEGEHSDGQRVRVRYVVDTQLRDFENVPLKESIDDYFRREVLPHVPDAWMDRSKDKVGYEINFNRHFYRYTPPRPLETIDAELKKAEDEILRLLKEVTT